MKAIKAAAIILSISDYKENDKIARVFTESHGKVNAVFKGVKKNGAKLKYAAMPFCFGNFELIKTAGPYTVTGCEVIESFFDLCYDYDRMQAGTKMLACTEKITAFDAPHPSLLVALLKHLKALLYCEDSDYLKFYLKYVTEAFALSGHALDFSEHCNECGERVRKPFFDLAAGGVVCSNCGTVRSLTMTESIHSIMRILCFTPLERLSTIKFGSDLTAESAFITQIISQIQS